MVRCICALVLLAATLCCQAPEGAQTPADKPGAPLGAKPLPKLWPWIEVAGTVPGSLESAVDGLVLWRQITDTAIISVGPNDTASLAAVQKRVSGMKFIPGVKTSPSLKPRGFDSIEGWRQIAQAVRTVAEITGSRTVLLENETSLEPFIKGEYPMNWEQLQAGLRQLPREYTILWYPSVAGGGEVLERYVRLCQAVQAVCDVQFVDHATLYAPATHTDAGTINAIKRLKEVAHKPPIELVYCYGEHWWPLEQVPEALRLVHGDAAIIYPGAKRWVEAAKVLVKLLPPQGRATSAPAGR